MGNSDDSALGKLGADGGLDEVVCVKVDGCRGLVQHQDLGASQQCPR